MADVIPYNEEDYLQEMRDRVTFAFEQSVVFDKYLQLFAQGTASLQEIFKQLMQERSIDTAVGKQLDIIGDIVGQPRELIDTDLIPYFGYTGAVNAQSYGDVNNSGAGGYYWDYTQPLAGSVLLNDAQYRLFIRAKILKNVTRATPEDVIHFISFVFKVDKVQITTDFGAEQALIFVPNTLNKFEVALLQYFVEKPYRSYFVPKSLGVGYAFGSFDPENFFSFVGVPGGKGYGTLVEDVIYDGTYDYDGTINYTGHVVIGGGIYASLY